MTPLDSRNYTVGCICALPVEMAATAGMLDEEHGKPFQQDPQDKNSYTLGKIGKHNVVIACLPDGVYGTTSAAASIAQMMSSFKCLRFALMIGIGGGVPSAQHDIRLGDVVVSKPKGTSSGVVQYDFGTAVQEGQLTPIGSLDKPPKLLLTAMSSLEAELLRRGNNISSHIKKMIYKHPHMRCRFSHQGIENDKLYASEYIHIDSFSYVCKECDSSRLVERPKRESLDPKIFYGTIGSGNQVIKNGLLRDKLAKKQNILCFEMEAAGLMDQIRCVIIRGVADYADSHKNKVWQEYAASTAAAYAKELLCSLPVGEVEEVCPSPGIRVRTNSGSSIGSGFSRSATLTPDNLDTLPASIFQLTTKLYMKEDIMLGSLVPDRRYPNQDALVEIDLDEWKDYSISTDQNFSGFVKSNAKSNSRFKRALSKIFLSPVVKDVGDVQILAEESRIYMMRQPRNIFKELSTNPSVRDWLTDFYLNGEDVYFVVGYRTLINAQFVGANLTIDQKSRFARSSPGARENYRYETSGERVYAVCFRKIDFKGFRKNGEGILDSTNCWRTFTEDRSAVLYEEEEDEMLAVDLDDEDSVDDDTFGISRFGSDLELVSF